MKKLQQILLFIMINLVPVFTRGGAYCYFVIQSRNRTDDFGSEMIDNGDYGNISSLFGRL